MKLLLAFISVVFCNGSTDFLVMGDWGGVPIIPWHTPAEADVAAAMGTEAAAVKATFALALGDNFYETGIKDEHDPRFKHTFEDVFTSKNLQSENFFKVLAGNHDHKGNVTGQIQYSSISSRWHFPSLYYEWTENVTDSDNNAIATAQFIMIDTVTLAGNSEDEHGESLMGDQYTGPADVAAAGTQMDWINATLTASTADYIIMSGHFPVWSVCEHGPTSRLLTDLKPLLEKHQVAVYFAGHDHCEQHIDEGNFVQYHVVGAANQNQGSAKNRAKVPKADLKFLDIGTGLIEHELEGGFASVKIDEAGLVVKHYRTKDSDYKLMYTAPAVPPVVRPKN